MSVGETVYTTDDRVGVTRKKDSTDWQLQFKFVKERDEGTYECQVGSSYNLTILHILHILHIIQSYNLAYLTISQSYYLTILQSYFLGDNVQWAD